MSDIVSGQERWPQQHLKASKKTKKWAKECIEAAEQIALFNNEGVRQNYYNKAKNYDLANGHLDVNDVERVMNPYQVTGGTFPAKMQNYPIANPKINLLVGEEWKRRFDYTIRVANHDAISRKEQQKKAEWEEKVRELIRRRDLDEKEMKEELQKFKKYLDYQFQDMRERRGNQIMNHYHHEHDFDIKFNRGFRDVLVAGEEIYKCDIVGNEPTMNKTNPLNIHTVRSGSSHRIEDSDIILEDGFLPPGQVIDEFHEHLSNEDIKALDSGKEVHGGDGLNIGTKEPDILLTDGSYSADYGGNNGGILSVNRQGEVLFGGGFDENGNVRVMRVQWKSMRQVKRLKYFNDKGDALYDVVHEDYEPDNSKGEEIVSKFWISEFWEGTRIADDIYVKIQPSPVQFRRMDNPSKCYPKYVGTAFNINESESVSLMDRMKPYQYFYNVLMYNLELAISKSKGKIAQLDLSKIPEGWDPELWLYYADQMGVAIVDSFKEGTEGMSRGKLAGNVNNTLGNNVLDLEMGQFVQQIVSMLQYIEQQLGSISGVTEAREGQISSQSLVGNTERSVTQSSHITEEWFLTHENTKKRVIQTFLETAKQALKGQSKKVQYVLGDASTQMFEIDGDDFAEQDYGIFVSNSSDDMELEQMIKQLAQAGIQNDKIDFSQLIDIYKSPSIASMTQKLEQAEEIKQQQQQRVQQQQIQEQEKERKARLQEKEMEMNQRDKELEEESARQEKKLHSERLLKQLETQTDLAKDATDKKISIEELKHKRDELEQTIEQKEKDLEQQDEHHDDEMQNEQERIDIERMEAKEKAKSDDPSGDNSDNSGGSE